MKIHHIVTGELESSLAVSLLNSGAHPALDQSQVLPYGFRHDIKRLNGDITSGVMVPVPVWLIEGAGKTILIDTGLGEIDEVSRMQSRYGVDFVRHRVRLVTRELALLLPMLDPGPGSPAQRLPRP